MSGNVLAAVAKVGLTARGGKAEGLVDGRLVSVDLSLTAGIQPRTLS